jgi:hypothetical protein
MSNAIVLNSTTDMIINRDVMSSMQTLAEYMAGSKITVPAHLRGNVGDCMAIIMQAAQWKMNPFAVAQKTHEVKGTLGYEAQLVNAVITAMAPTVDRLHYEWYGAWEKVIGKFEIKRSDKGEYRVPAWKLADEEGLGVRVWATMKGEDQPRVLDILLAQARTRNSTLWADDPKQQIAYLAVKRWSRLYCPDVIMGVYTTDEAAEFNQSPERDVTPEPTQSSTLDSIMQKANETQPTPELDLESFNLLHDAITQASNLDEFATAMDDVKSANANDEQLAELRKAATAKKKELKNPPAEIQNFDNFDD